MIKMVAQRAILALAIVVGIVVGQQAPALAARTTYGDVVCKNYGLGVKEVTDKAWGLGYARNTNIKVYRHLWINNKWWRSTSNNLVTSSSGSWSTPTGTYDASLLSGKVELQVAVEGPRGEDWGAAGDTCSL
jgi:hypothetical protein